MSSHFHIIIGVLIVFYLCSLGQTISKVDRTKVLPSFSIDYQNNQFLLDGQPFRYISGSIHYFRIHRSQWKDRLQRVRALGLNAIQYYIPWNYHEIFEGEYNFAGGRNFSEFSIIAHELGMYSLIRLGIAIVIISFNLYFKNAVQTWFSVLLPLIKPLLRKNNGPVLMVQIENEYGSYKECDRNYTAWLRDLTRKFLGKDTVVYTTDGSGDSFLKCGTVPDTLATVDFGPSSKAAINASFSAQKKFLPQGKIDSMKFLPPAFKSFLFQNVLKLKIRLGQGPLVNSEFYPGWFVLWGEKTVTIPSTKSVVESAQYMYSLGASMNFYMIHGGTNFGFWSGAENNAPCITSYDYFAPISEAGDITEKYLAIRSWIKGIPGWKTRPLDIPKNNPLAYTLLATSFFHNSFGVLNLQPLNDLSEPPNERNCVFSELPMSFEQIGQPFGFVLYTRKMETCGKRLHVKQLKDFGYVYLQKKHLGTLVHSYYGKSKNSVGLNGCAPGDKLIILVENQGRQTFETINDPKGIISDVEMDEIVLNGWIQCKMNIANDYADIVSPSMSFCLRESSTRDDASVTSNPPAVFCYPEIEQNCQELNSTSSFQTFQQSAGAHGLYRGFFNVSMPTDTFLNTKGWGKGVAIVNGKNLGRYWASEGPQYTLYVPSAFLRLGMNSVTIIELENTHNCLNGSCSMSFVDHPIFDLNITTTNYI
ncbi:unnamed protein product [Angiostrongylus costaricensis]|uniref:Glyco_hydro_35 domain-containing protein n=1 Tax=Angiostrongylus costaricensis TaxID=334426 RepID=A0A158PM76_ANGCS|nr:unnamed protein product [Angiostrongylus costaricensis]